MPETIPVPVPSDIDDELQGFRVWQGKGLSYAKKKEYDLAIFCFEMALNYEKKDIEIYTDIALVYELNGNLDKAIAYYQIAIRKNPKGYLAWYKLALNYFKSKDYWKAAELLETGILHIENSFLLYFLLGKTYFYLNMPKKSEKMLIKALGIDPDNKDALRFLAELHLNLGKTATSLGSLDKDVLALVENPDIWFKIGNIYYTAGNYPESLKALKKSVFYDDKYLEAYILMADIYQKLNEIEKSEQCFLAVLSIDKKNVTSLKKLARIYIEKKEFKKAKKYIQELLTETNFDKHLLKEYINLLVELKAFKTALMIIKYFKTKNYSDSEIDNLFMILLFKIGKFRELDDIIRKTKLEEDNFDILLLKGKMAYLKEDFDSALEYFGRASDILENSEKKAEVEYLISETIRKILNTTDLSENKYNKLHRYGYKAARTAYDAATDNISYVISFARYLLDLKHIDMVKDIYVRYFHSHRENPFFIYLHSLMHSFTSKEDVIDMRNMIKSFISSFDKYYDKFIFMDISGDYINAIVYLHSLKDYIEYLYFSLLITASKSLDIWYVDRELLSLFPLLDKKYKQVVLTIGNIYINCDMPDLSINYYKKVEEGLAGDDVGKICSAIKKLQENDYAGVIRQLKSVRRTIIRYISNDIVGGYLLELYYKSYLASLIKLRGFDELKAVVRGIISLDIDNKYRIISFLLDNLVSSGYYAEGYDILSDKNFSVFTDEKIYQMAVEIYNKLNKKEQLFELLLYGEKNDILDEYGLVLLANIYIEKQDYKKAYNLLKKIEKRKNFIVLDKLGEILYFMGDYEKAELYLREAVEIMPTYTVSKINLAKVYIVEKKYGKAEDILEYILSEDRNLKEVYILLSEIYLDTNKVEKIHPLLSGIVDDNLEDIDFIKKIIMIYSRARLYSELWNIINKLNREQIYLIADYFYKLWKKTDDLEKILLISELYGSAGYIKKQRILLLKLMKNISLHYKIRKKVISSLINLYLAVDKYAKALKIVNKYGDEIDNVRIFIELYNYYIDKNDIEAVLNIMELIASRDYSDKNIMEEFIDFVLEHTHFKIPDSVINYLYKGKDSFCKKTRIALVKLLIDQKQYEKAEKIMSELIEGDSRNIEYLMLMAEIYAKKMDKSGVNHMTSIIADINREAGREKSPEVYEIWLKVGNLHKRVGDYEKAALYYKKAILSDISNPMAYKSIISLYSEIGLEEKSLEYKRMLQKIMEK